MAKKKRKKRSSGHAPPRADQHASARAERKEAARKERERRISAARRRRLLRRAAVVGVAVAVVAAIVVVVVINVGRSREREQQAQADAAAAGCSDVESPPDEGAQHVDAPPAYQNVPASSGAHSGAPLPAEVHVYDQPADDVFEFRAVHNLEHGYVLIYYQPEGDNALPDADVQSLAGVADQSEVIMAPYPNLPAGDNLTFVAWNRVQRCQAQGSPEDIAAAAEGFIEQFKNGSEAPEAGVP